MGIWSLKILWAKNKELFEKDAKQMGKLYEMCVWERVEEIYYRRAGECHTINAATETCPQ